MRGDCSARSRRLPRSTSPSAKRALPLDLETIAAAIGRDALRHDRDGEEHFNVVSALIKSLRASDPDAALHYLARMVEAGEDPLYVARRLVIFASEDVGNADPRRSRSRSRPTRRSSGSACPKAASRSPR